MTPLVGIRKLEPDAAAAVVHHAGHLGSTCAELLNDCALVVLCHVDDQFLERFLDAATSLAGDDLGPADLELVALAPHHLDQNRKLQLATADHLQLVSRIGVLDANRDIADQLAPKSLAQFAGRDVLTILPGQGRGVHPKDHGDRRLIHVHGRERPRVVGRGDGLADGDVVDPGKANNVAGRGLLHLGPLQSVKDEQPGDAGSRDQAIELRHGDLVAEGHAAVDDPSNRDPAQVVA